MRKAEDAELIDTSFLDADAVFEKALDVVRRRLGRAGYTNA